MRVVLSAICLAISTSAGAAPVYLECWNQPFAGPANIRLSLNEDDGKVTYEVPSKNVLRVLPAIFSVDEVQFFLFSSEIVQTYFKVSRVDLSFNVMNEFVNQSPKVFVAGKCKLAEHQNRAF